MPYYLKMLSTSCGRNGANKLALCRVSAALQFVNWPQPFTPKDMGPRPQPRCGGQRALVKGRCFTPTARSSFFSGRLLSRSLLVDLPTEGGWACPHLCRCGVRGRGGRRPRARASLGVRLVPAEGLARRRLPWPFWWLSPPCPSEWPCRFALRQQLLTRFSVSCSVPPR